MGEPDLARNTELVFANAYDILPLHQISADPSLLEIPFHSRNIPRPGYYKFNWPRVTDPELDSLLERGAGAADPADRARLYADAQQRIMDSAGWFPMHDQVNTIARRQDRLPLRPHLLDGAVPRRGTGLTRRLGRRETRQASWPASRRGGTACGSCRILLAGQYLA